MIIQKERKIAHPRSHKHSPHQGFSKHSLPLVAVLAVLVARRLRLGHPHRHPGQSFDGFFGRKKWCQWKSSKVMRSVLFCWKISVFQRTGLFLVLVKVSENWIWFRYIFCILKSKWQTHLLEFHLIISNLQSNVQMSKNFLKLSASSTRFDVSPSGHPLRWHKVAAISHPLPVVLKHHRLHNVREGHHDLNISYGQIARAEKKNAQVKKLTPRGGLKTWSYKLANSMFVKDSSLTLPFQTTPMIFSEDAAWLLDELTNLENRIHGSFWGQTLLPFLPS